ncbi:hypothetical protein N7535_000668 [Penicillium sp. DV-2018c]|nr:hypothetical protein N7461_006081 [Penicillium sp. DV-2018c]KAJ5582048.1 hypothetical protein N7535_000668 [Penicillium sp. DV-2018c]
MDGPPPPPPPHGEKPRTTEGEYRKSSDLPDGNYDIFIVPPHSAGAGFLYLPSLQYNRNSFLAGVASTLFACVVWSYISPILKAWYLATVASGSGTGMTALAVGVGVAGWLLGAAQSGTGNDKGNGSARGGWFGFGGFGGSSGGPGGSRNAEPNSSGANYGGNGAGHQRQQQGGNYNGGQKHGNQYSGNQYSSGAPPNSDDNQREKEEAERRAKEERAREERAREERAKEERERQERAREERAREERARERAREEAERERAREEAKRKEELRRKMEEFKRKRDAEAKEKEKQREREAMEKELKERREQLEKEIAAAKAAAEKETRERLEKEAAEAREKQAKAEAEAKAKLEKLEAEARERAAKEAAEKEAAAKAAAQKEAMAKFAALKEAAAKKYAEKKAQEAKQEAAAKSPPPKPASTSSMPRTPSPKKPPPPYPTAKAANDDDAYSFRPYDRPRRPYAAGTSVYSESSYAPSHSTAHTTPPPSHRSSYTTKDPDKIVIQGVYTFNNAFMKTPISQLVSGQGMITDGLVLRITTEGLFIDDDVRGIGQREWDVKAWTLKLAEVWCAQVNATTSAKTPSSNPFSFHRGNNVPTNGESEAFLNNLLKVCKNTCRLASPRDAFARSATGGPVHAPGAETRGLHILRASVRDQEGKKYVFVMQESEAWKVAIGLQRLRAGALVRSLGVTALPAPDCKLILGSLGYV